VTGREIRDEYCVPSFDLVARVRARRLRWAGHLLRASEEYLPRRVAVAQLESDLQWGALSGTASIFQDAPDGFELDELVELAEDRVCWRAMVKAIEPEDALWEQRQLRSRKKAGTEEVFTPTIIPEWKLEICRVGGKFGRYGPIEIAGIQIYGPWPKGYEGEQECNCISAPINLRIEKENVKNE